MIFDSVRISPYSKLVVSLGLLGCPRILSKTWLTSVKQCMSWIMHFLHTITQWFVPWCHIQSFSYRETWLDMLYIGDWFSHGLISSSEPDSTCREFLPDRWRRKRRSQRSWRRPRQNSWRWPRICRLPSEDICWQTSWKSEATFRFTSYILFISGL